MHCLQRIHNDIEDNNRRMHLRYPLIMPRFDLIQEWYRMVPLIIVLEILPKGRISTSDSVYYHNKAEI